MFRNLANPDSYHGVNKSKNYFEGWYYKLVEPSLGLSLAIIPGIFKSSTEKYSHSFIQILYSKNNQFNYIRFPYSDFLASKNEFKFIIGTNCFSLTDLQLSIKRPECTIQGNINFYNIKKWPDSLINPGSMGFYNYLSFMQCYSQVCAMSASINGKIIFNGETLDFNNGNCYIEKNWGKAFPNSWIWVQCNSFKTHFLGLTCSIGHVPFLAGSFRGFLIGLYHNNNFYKFTTINRSKLTITRHNSDVNITVYNSRYCLTFCTQSQKNKFLLINGPRDDKMIPLVNETLEGEVALELIDNRNNSIIVKDQGLYAGIEYGGEQKMI